MILPAVVVGRSADEDEFCQKNQEGHEASCQPTPGWSLNDEHPCNIPILTPNDILDKFGPDGVPIFHDHPLIVRNPLANPLYRKMTARQNVTALVGESVTLPNADLHTFALTPQEVLLEDFLNSPETLPTDIAKNKPYFFQDVGASLRDGYDTPKTPATSSDRRLGLGTLGSGVQWHAHGPGFCEILHGRKLWLLYGTQTRPNADWKYVSRHWMENYYSDADFRSKDNKIWQCVAQPGDAIYFPQKWFHMTVNLDNYCAFVTSFFEH